MRWKVRFPVWCTCRGPCWRSADFWSRWFRPQCVCGRRRWSPPSICAWPESTRLHLGDGSAWMVMYGEVFWEEGKCGLSLYNWFLLHANDYQSKLIESGIIISRVKHFVGEIFRLFVYHSIHYKKSFSYTYIVLIGWFGVEILAYEPFFYFFLLLDLPSRRGECSDWFSTI